MPTLRAFCHLLLALTLVANGWIGGAAAAASHLQHTVVVIEDATPTAASDCHDSGHDLAAAPQKADPASMDCCDQSGCDCGCLHHAAVVLQTFASMSARSFQRVAVIGHRVTMVNIPTEPAIRPPIAA